MKKILVLLLASGMLTVLAACGSAQKETEAATRPSSAAADSAQRTQPPTAAETTLPQTTAALQSTGAPQEETVRHVEPETEEQPRTEEITQEENDLEPEMTIGSTPVSVAWEDNEAVRTLKALCLDQPLTINMSMYGGFEQVGSIGAELPASDVQTTTSAGDIVLYSGNQMVVFYGSNTWAYTRLGHITDKTPEELTQLLSNGDTTITIK